VPDDGAVAEPADAGEGAAYSWEDVYPENLRAADESSIGERRGVAGVTDPPSERQIGLALSGGGIRSATFSLGVLQAMAREKLLRRVDYLSTVSGGGYIGSFLGGLFTGDRAKNQRPPVAKVEATLSDNTSKPLGWLRENGRYLSPNGGGDLLLAGAVGIRNWVAIQVILGTLFMTLLLFAEVLRSLVLRSDLNIGKGGLRIILAVLFVTTVVPLAWAYWLAQSWKGRSRADWTLPPLLAGIATLIVSVVLLVLHGPGNRAALLLAVVSGLALAYAGAAYLQAKHDDPTVISRSVNNLLSRWLKGAFLATGTALAFAVLDDLGNRLYVCLRDSGPGAVLGGHGIVFTTGASLLVFGRKLASFLASSTGGKQRLRLPLGLLAGAAALAIAAGVLISLSATAHAFADGWGGCLPNGLWWAFVVGLALTVVFGRTLPFLNQSSLQALYAARLTRAYLGASNPERWKPEGGNLTELMQGDGVEMARYKPHKSGGPIHLINVTLNETVSGKSQIEQRDRKGLGMAVGPNAYSVGARHHLLMSDIGVPLEPPEGKSPEDKPPKNEKSDFRIFPTGHPINPEPLDLGTWISISGAAFTTGLGSRTSLGLSLLCGFFNVRLGYWWNSGIAPGWRTQGSSPSLIGRVYAAFTRFLPVHMHLLDEFLARFPGSASKRWYLSDGGHFENTGCYELLRRRLPLIILCDDGADASYTFTDLANLVRKARTDFGAEISFLDDDAITQLGQELAKLFGPLEHLRPCQRKEPVATSGDSPAGPCLENHFSKKHGAIARLEYPDGKEGLLVVLKPTLTGDEPLDLIEYHASHPAFPQEPTSEQFFDEAQWESYRKLGETIGHQVFSALAIQMNAGTFWKAPQQQSQRNP
jgi:hypothetical protein